MIDVILKVLVVERQVFVDCLVQQFVDVGIWKFVDDFVFV